MDCEVRNTTMVACYNYTGATMRISGGYYQSITADRAIENDGGTIFIGDWATVDGATRAPLGTYLVVNNSANVYIESMRWVGVPVDSGGNFTIVAIGPRTVTGMIERVSGLASYFAAKSGGTSKWHRKQPINMDGIGTLFSGTGQSTFGTVTLTGTTPVAIPWTDWKAGNQFFHSRSTLVGAPGDITYTSTPGVGVSIVSSTAETSVVNWRID